MESSSSIAPGPKLTPLSRASAIVSAATALATRRNRKGRPPADAWTSADARELYMIDKWGGGYFDVNEAQEPAPSRELRWTTLAPGPS